MARTQARELRNPRKKRKRPNYMNTCPHTRTLASSHGIHNARNTPLSYVAENQIHRREWQTREIKNEADVTDLIQLLTPIRGRNTCYSSTPKLDRTGKNDLPHAEGRDARNFGYSVLHHGDITLPYLQIRLLVRRLWIRHDNPTWPTYTCIRIPGKIDSPIYGHMRKQPPLPRTIKETRHTNTLNMTHIPAARWRKKRTIQLEQPPGNIYILTTPQPLVRNQQPPETQSPISI